MRKISLLFTTFLLVSCYQQERNCADFRTGKFKFEHEIDGQTKVTYFERKDSLEIENYEGKIDSSHVRWINDCEYVLHDMGPNNRHEQKGVNIKIRTIRYNTNNIEFNLERAKDRQQGSDIKL